MSEQPDQASEWRQLVEEAVLAGDSFIRATLSGGNVASGTAWKRVSIRPVLVKGARLLQFNYYDEKAGTARNYGRIEAIDRLREALSSGFTHVHVQSTVEDLHIRITKKGKPLLSRARPSRAGSGPDLAHNQSKNYILGGPESDEFLEAIGVKDKDGSVKPSMQGKFRQINEFLRIIESVLPGSGSQGTFRLVDCGSGNAYLTFAAFHYLAHRKAIPTIVTGVDINPDVIAHSVALRNRLGWDGLDFVVSPIIGYDPLHAPDLVLSLHACDTATDEAIVRGIGWGSGAILAAPCCQHELHHLLKAEVFRPVLRHGVLRERLADIVTDAFRALILRIMGYSTDVVEFVSPEHTSKNLMIRAVRGANPGDARFVREYKDLKDFWGVTPIMERLLGDRLARYL